MRRLHLIPLLQKFKREVTEGKANEHPADEHLKEKLLTEAGGILRWAIDGAVEWYAKGLRQPTTVKRFTGDFFNTADPYENWIAACGHENDAKSFTSSKDLYSNWSRYCDGIRERPGDLKAFMEDLEKRTEIFTKARPKKNNKQERGFFGLKLMMIPKSDTAPMTEEQKKQLPKRREEVPPIGVAAADAGRNTFNNRGVI